LVEVPIVGVSCGPAVLSKSVLRSLIELSLILLPYFERQLPQTLFEIAFPESPIDISIFVLIESIVAEVVLEQTLKDISIEEHQSAFDFEVIFPATFEASIFAELVDAPAVLLSVEKLALVLVLVDILEESLSVGEVAFELTLVYTAVSEVQLAFSFPATSHKLPDIGFLREFIFVVAVAVPFALLPASLIDLFLAAVDSLTVFEASVP
jgi:hypothetical protein